MSRTRPRRRTIATAVVGTGIVVALVLGLIQAGPHRSPATDVPSAQQARAAVAGAPPALAALYARGGELVDVAPRGWNDYLAKLRGYPVVINVWAEWCDPCRAEFPLLRTVAAHHGTRVAFLGVSIDAASHRGKAEAFLRREPTVYPNLADPQKKIARRLEAMSATPSTVFLDAEGEIVTVRQGSYGSTEQLERDLRLYAGLDRRPAPGATETRRRSTKR